MGLTPNTFSYNFPIDTALGLGAIYASCKLANFLDVADSKTAALAVTVGLGQLATGAITRLPTDIWEGQFGYIFEKTIIKRRIASNLCTLTLGTLIAFAGFHQTLRTSLIVSFAVWGFTNIPFWVSNLIDQPLNYLDLRHALKTNLDALRNERSSNLRNIRLFKEDNPSLPVGSRAKEFSDYIKFYEGCPWILRFIPYS